MIIKTILAVFGGIGVVAGAITAVFTAVGKIRVAFGRKRLGKPVAADTPGADPLHRPWVIGVASRAPQEPPK